MPLSALDLAVLAFERLRWVHAGAREAAIAERFGVTAVRHAQRVNRVIDDPAALEHDAQLVRRLQRLRAARQRGRSARTLARWAG